MQDERRGLASNYIRYKHNVLMRNVLAAVRSNLEVGVVTHFFVIMAFCRRSLSTQRPQKSRETAAIGVDQEERDEPRRSVYRSAIFIFSVVEQ